MSDATLTLTKTKQGLVHIPQYTSGVRQHTDGSSSIPTVHDTARGNEGYEETPRKNLRPLTSLKWPTIPEPPAILDPLDTTPEPLQLYQYTAIGMSWLSKSSQPLQRAGVPAISQWQLISIILPFAQLRRQP